MKSFIRLSEVRKAKGLTQSQLAKKLGVTQGAVQKWEANVRYPDLPHLMALTDILGCTVEELIERR